MSDLNRKNGLSLTGVFALTLITLAFQNCAPVGSSTSAKSATETGIDAGDPAPNPAPAPAPTPGNTQLQKIPTKDCLFNNVTYKCVVISYGTHSLQDYELWLPNTAHVSGDLPLVIYTHGGGYYKGDRTDAYNAFSSMQGALDHGYAFATVNYRLSGEFPFEKDVTGKYPAEMQDLATALQDLRMRASHYSYNPEKIALTGVSAGGGISLWVAFHDDLKNTSSTNVRDHYSTRVSCVAVADTQTTLNIAEIAPLLGAKFELDVGIPALYGFTPELYNANPSYYQTRYAASMLEASPISHISADDNVKLLLTYIMGYGTGNIHAPEFGFYFAAGTPKPLATQFGRTSLAQLNKPYSVLMNRGKNVPTDIIAHINGCF